MFADRDDFQPYITLIHVIRICISICVSVLQSLGTGVILKLSANPTQKRQKTNFPS